jgi:Mg/Co/Ni transporter MgtE
VPRNAVVGAGVGVVLAAVLYFVRVLELFGPFAGTREFPVLGPEGWFLLLAFVLATTTAMIVAAVLTVLSAISLLRDA